MKTQAVAAGEFKAKCLKLLDEVASTRQALTITKRGRPVAQVVLIAAQRPLFGAMKGSVLVQRDVVAPVGDEWEAAACPACWSTRMRWSGGSTATCSFRVAPSGASPPRRRYG